MGTADHKLSGGVNMKLVVPREQGLDALAHRCLHTRNQQLGDVLFDLSQHRRIALPKLVVLGAQDNGLNAQWRAVVVVFNRDLALGIGTQVRHLLALLADVRELAQQAVAQLQRQRHVVVRLAARVPEHHTLITRALVFWSLTLHALVDV